MDKKNFIIIKARRTGYSHYTNKIVNSIPFEYLEYLKMINRNNIIDEILGDEKLLIKNNKND
jgi:hypothetical protein